MVYTNCNICGNELESPKDNYCYIPYVTENKERRAYRSCAKCESKFGALAKRHDSERRALKKRQAEELEMFYRGEKKSGFASEEE